MASANQFDGDRNAGVKDSSGNFWWIATHIEDVSPEEMERRSEAYMKKQSGAENSRTSNWHERGADLAPQLNLTTKAQRTQRRLCLYLQIFFVSFAPSWFTDFHPIVVMNDFSRKSE
jgi:hypothetical protein